MKKQYLKPMIMVYGIEPTVLLAGSGPNSDSNPDDFCDDLDNNQYDGPKALSMGNGFKSCWED